MHFPTLAGNEVLQEFYFKLTPMSNAVPSILYLTHPNLPSLFWLLQ
ncbi:hypothetical protein GXM_05410 [Nostoc sphaeroides CCNUC1]|uniref:Uncharacterized protein n=1 Tax=Nostoc sphaeroides CCNUC1 TaxID=2653204 RepID=A0A5P8W5B6_9NOSO|nr:hypothetical protein GXM_05410 [Nostoc sphaeroides CCNUC1]